MNKLSLITVGALFIGSVAQADVLIDDFDVDQTLTQTGVGTVASSAAEGIGGERDVQLEVTGPGNSTVNINTLVASQFALSSQAATSGRATVQWDGADNSSALGFGLGGLDLSAENVFQIDVVSSDLGFDFSVGVYTSAVNFAVITIPSAAVMPPGQSFFIEFSTFAQCALPFVTCGGTGADFSNINALEATINVNQVVERDMRIGRILATTVPAPATLALMGLGLIGLRSFSRKKAIS